MRDQPDLPLGINRLKKHTKISIMKRLGLILMIIGLLMTLFTGFKVFTKKKILDIGNVKISKSEPHKVNWSPFVGMGIMIAGGIMLIAGPKRSH